MRDMTLTRADKLETAHPVDVHVGAMLRMIRKRAGMSQQKLAAQLGLTFQQVQKYEFGTNRVSASKLWEISQILGVPVSAFYEGLDGTLPNKAEALLLGFMSMPEGVEFMRLLPDVRTDQRAKLLSFVETLVR